VLWAVQNGYVDDVPVDKTKNWQQSFTEFLTLHKPELLKKIGQEKSLSDSLTAEIKTAGDSFKQSWR